MRKKEIETRDNMSFSLEVDDTHISDQDIDVNKLMADFHALEVMSDDVSIGTNDHDYDSVLAKEKHYDINYNVKQLSLIHEYYGLGSVSKKKKGDIIMSIVEYENNPDNIDMVSRRELLWQYIDEIKKDPVLGKYVITP